MPTEGNPASAGHGKTIVERPVKKPVVRRIVVAAAFLAICVGIIFGIGTGTISSFGWESIASICPLGVLETMLAAKTMIPQGVIFFLIAAVLLIVLGKFFCSWICPIPSIRNILDSVTGRRSTVSSKATKREDGSEVTSLFVTKPLTRREQKALAKAAVGSDGCSSKEGSLATGEAAAPCAKSCGSCTSQARSKIDSRHIILGGSLISAAIFGFPVFCLICPIGLTFASVVAIVQLFGSQTLSWSLLVFPAILLLEMTVLRKWCHRFCPMGALVSILSVPNRFLRPKVDMDKCLQSKGIECEICVGVCPEGIDPHSKVGMHECSKCRDCAINCPAGAISFPLLQNSKELEKK